MSKKKKKAHKKGHGGSFFLGFVLLLFAAFGAYQAVHLTVEKVNAMRGGSSRITEYEEFLEPFVAVDPAVFDDVSGAEQTDLLDAAISALIFTSERMNTYEVFEGEVTGLLVPQADVERYFVKLFGKEVQMHHQSVTDSFYNVIYNSERASYIIPITSVDPTYTPKVYNSERTGNSITLTVGYIIGSEWAQLERGSYVAPEPAKYMKITLREDEDGYHIGSLRNSEAVETADPAKTTAPATTFPQSTAPMPSTTAPSTVPSTTLPDAPAPISEAQSTAAAG